MSVLRFVVKRLLLVLPSLLGLALLTFVLLRLVPADPAVVLAGEGASPEQVAALRAQYGLDQGLPEQLLAYFTQLFKGDFGVSLFSNRPVLEEVLQRLPATLELSFAALLIAVVLGIPLGTVAALNHNGLADRAIRMLTMGALAVASFWVGILLQLLFAMELGWLPLRGRIDAEIPMPPAFTGMLLVDAVLAGRADALRSALLHLLLPALSLSLAALATIARFTRVGVLDTLNKDFVTYARAAGVGPQRLVWIYVLRNSLTTTVTQIGLLFGGLMGGAVAVEAIFDWPGLGSYAVNAVLSFDTRAVLAVTLLIGAIYALVNIGVDLVQAWLDPRVRAQLS